MVGHRGAAALAPENSLASLEAAVGAGVALVEFDLVAGLRLAHSRRDLTSETIDLETALDFLAANGVGVQLDLKDPGLEEGVAAAVARHGLGERTLISTAFASIARRMQEVAPQLPRAIGYPRDRAGVARLRWPQPLVVAGAAALRAVVPARIPLLLRAARADVLALHHTLVSERAVRRAHAYGAPVLAWTVDEPEAVARLARLGVDGIVSDDPGRALATLAAL